MSFAEMGTAMGELGKSLFANEQAQKKKQLGEQASPDIAPAAPAAETPKQALQPKGDAGGKPPGTGTVADLGDPISKLVGSGLDAMFSFSAAKRKETLAKQESLMGAVGQQQGSMISAANRTAQLGASLKPLG